MKQKISGFDRFLLILLALLVIAAGLALVCTAMNLITADMIAGMAAFAYNGIWSALAVGGIGAVLLVLAFRVLVAFNSRARETKPESVLVSSGEFGSTFISIAALDGMVQKHCRANPQVKECISTVAPRDEGITVQLKLSTIADINIPDLTAELQRTLKAYVESMSGIPVKDIGILVLNAPANPKAHA